MTSYETQSAAVGAAADVELATAHDQVSTLTAANQTLVAKNADLQAQLDAATKPPVPVPPKAVTTYGACPISGGWAAVAKRWDSLPEKACVRAFQSGGTPKLSDIPQEADRRVAYSYKPPIGSLSSGAGIGALQSFLASLTVPTDVCMWHEIDSKVNKGQVDAAAWKADMAAAVKTFAQQKLARLGYIVTLWTRGSWQTYHVDGFTWLGVDYDGLAPGKTAADGYPTKSMDAYLADSDAIKAAGLALVVGEFGAQLASWDTTPARGSARAAWMTKYGQAFAANGYEYVCAYESHSYDNPDGTGYCLDDAASANAWRALIG
jgi:hypothetical protein